MMAYQVMMDRRGFIFILHIVHVSSESDHFIDRAREELDPR